MNGIISRLNSRLLLAKFLLLRYQLSLLVTSRELWWMNQEWLELRWRTHNRSVMVLVHGTPCAIPSCNSSLTDLLPWDLPAKTCTSHLLHACYMLRLVHQTGFKQVWCQILTAASMNLTFLWDTAPCSLTRSWMNFRDVYCLHHRGD
jgi:hypothetical protein